MASGKLRLTALFIAVVCVGFLFGLSAAQAGEPVHLVRGADEIRIGTYLEILEDRNKSLSIDQVTSEEFSSQFMPSDEPSPGFGFTASAYWLRFTLKNDQEKPRVYYLDVEYPLLDHVDFYLPTESGGYLLTRAGDKLPFAQREYYYKTYLFPIAMAPGEQSTYYLRCESESSMSLPMKLLSLNGLVKAISNEQTLLGIYFGILLVMMLYNLFIYVSIRDITYIYYVLFVGSFIIFQLSIQGMAYAHIWPESTWWANNSTPFFIFVSYVFATQFTRQILNTPKYLPRMDKALQFCMNVSIVGAFITFFADYSLSIKMATIMSLTVVIMFVSGLLCTLKGYRPARYYFIAWSLSLLGILVYALKSFAILPTTFLTTWGLQIGSAWEVILLSLGLADRLYLMKKEKDEIRHQYAVKLERANSELEKFNIELEELVEQRTADVKQVNIELTRVAEERKAAEERAEAANKAKSQFLATMSHEIRTPMTSIIGMARLATKQKLTPKMKTYLEIIQDSGNSLLALINDILDFSKIEADKLELEDVSFDLRDVFGSVADMFSKKVAEKNIELVIQLGQDVPCALIGDPLRLKQVFVNLTNNAVKFTKRGEVELSAMLKEQGADRVVLEFMVRDTGSGINHDQIKNLFSEYNQGETSTARLYGGTGLGLAISKRLVSLMAGEIKADSEQGKGSTFRFSAVFRLQHQEMQQPMTLPTTLHGLEVLVAVANATLRKGVAGMLESFGCRVRTVGNLDELQARLASSPPEDPNKFLLIIDWGLRTESGSVIASLAGSLQKPRPKLILMANILDGDQVMSAESDAIDALIIKPAKQVTVFNAVLGVFGQGGKNFPHEIEQQAGPVYEIGPNLRGKTILVVEDDSIIRNYIKKELSGEGIGVETAAGGAEALDLLKRRKVDAVLMDIQMPDMDGYKTCEMIRANLELATLPVVALTGNVQEGYEQKCVEAGMNGYVFKPINFAELYEILESVITED